MEISEDTKEVVAAIDRLVTQLRGTSLVAVYLTIVSMAVAILALIHFW